MSEALKHWEVQCGEVRTEVDAHSKGAAWRAALSLHPDSKLAPFGRVRQRRPRGEWYYADPEAWDQTP